MVFKPRPLPATVAPAEQTDAEKTDLDKYPAGPLHIFFGSQTGTAEGFSRILSDEGKAKGFNITVVDLEDFDAEMLKKVRAAVFLMATYGEGEPTDNANKFFTWLKNEEEEIPTDYLRGFKYTVFGLGNKQYDHYNRMGRLTNELLEKIGADRMFMYGEGDDDGTLEADFEGWKEQMWAGLLERFLPESAHGTSSTSQLIPHMPDLNYRLIFTDSDHYLDEFKFTQIQPSQKYFFTSPLAPVVVNRELRDPLDGGSTRHIEIDIRNTGLTYTTADNLAVLPENSDELVEIVAQAMGYNLSQCFVFEPCDIQTFKHPFPTPCTVREALKKYCDLQGLIRRATLTSLLPFVTDAKQREYLERLCSKDGRAEYVECIEKEYRSIADLLQSELSSARVPLDQFLHLVPSLQPRYYTISSSSSVYPDTIHCTVSVTEKELSRGRRFRGACSGFLQSLVAGQASCRVFVRESSFRLPPNPSTPIVMVGPGTGLAPMRALLQERKFLAESKENGSCLVGRNVLYFGCRSRCLDFIYKEELQNFQEEGILTSLYLAFSREGPSKVYVQHLMSTAANEAEIMSELFNGNAYFYVCGATAMGKDVHETLVSILMKGRNIHKAEAVRVLEELQQTGRYVQELWSA